MSHLKWLVVRDLNLIESATFWKDGPEIATGEMRTEDIGTEVFFLPAAAHTEKDGTFTQTQRLLQWHHKAVEPSGDCRSELHFFYHLGRMLRERLATSTLERDLPLRTLALGLPAARRRRARRRSGVARDQRSPPQRREGRADAQQLRRDEGGRFDFGWLLDLHGRLQPTASTRSARRKPGSEQSWVAPEWGWAWPMNRRILYNRASADPEGKPWSERKAYVWWDEAAGKWTGHDVPDFQVTKAPSFRPEPGVDGPDGLAGDDPFIMQADGKGWLYAPSGLLDGPLPVHYEPVESPLRNALHPQQSNPTRDMFPRQREPHEPVATGAGQRRLSVRRHHLPAHRASHRRWHEPLVAVPRRVAA